MIPTTASRTLGAIDLSSILAGAYKGGSRNAFFLVFSLLSITSRYSRPFLLKKDGKKYGVKAQIGSFAVRIYKDFSAQRSGLSILYNNMLKCLITMVYAKGLSTIDAKGCAMGLSAVSANSVMLGGAAWA